MKNLNTYILEKFKIDSEIDPLSTDEFNDHHPLAKKMANILADCVKRNNWPREHYIPKFLECLEDKKEKYRMHPNKDDDNLFMFGRTIGELYVNVANFFGTLEDREEAKNYVNKYEKNK